MLTASLRSSAQYLVHDRHATSQGQRQPGSNLDLFWGDLLALGLTETSCAEQSKREAESRQREERDAQVKVEFMRRIEEQRQHIDTEFNNDVIRLEATHRIMATSD